MQGQLQHNNYPEYQQGQYYYYYSYKQGNNSNEGKQRNTKREETSGLPEKLIDYQIKPLKYNLLLYFLHPKNYLQQIESRPELKNILEPKNFHKLLANLLYIFSLLYENTYFNGIISLKDIYFNNEDDISIMIPHDDFDSDSDTNSNLINKDIGGDVNPKPNANDNIKINSNDRGNLDPRNNKKDYNSQMLECNIFYRKILDNSNTQLIYNIFNRKPNSITMSTPSNKDNKVIYIGKNDYNENTSEKSDESSIFDNRINGLKHFLKQFSMLLEEKYKAYVDKMYSIDKIFLYNILNIKFTKSSELRLLYDLNEIDYEYQQGIYNKYQARLNYLLNSSNSPINIKKNNNEDIYEIELICSIENVKYLKEIMKECPNFLEYFIFIKSNAYINIKFFVVNIESIWNMLKLRNLSKSDNKSILMKEYIKASIVYSFRLIYFWYYYISGMRITDISNNSSKNKTQMIPSIFGYVYDIDTLPYILKKNEEKNKLMKSELEKKSIVREDEIRTKLEDELKYMLKTIKYTIYNISKFSNPDQEIKYCLNDFVNGHYIDECLNKAYNGSLCKMKTNDLILLLNLVLAEIKSKDYLIYNFFKPFLPLQTKSNDKEDKDKYNRQVFQIQADEQKEYQIRSGAQSTIEKSIPNSSNKNKNRPLKVLNDEVNIIYAKTGISLFKYLRCNDNIYNYDMLIKTFTIENQTIHKKFNSLNGAIESIFDSKSGQSILYNKDYLYFDYFINNEKQKKQKISEIYYANGESYHGDWDGKYNGSGILYAFNGTIKYQGSWLNDKYNGKGTLKFANGQIYEGHFKDGKLHGQGSIYTSEKILAMEGTWNNDKKDGDFVKYSLFNQGVKYFETYKDDVIVKHNIQKTGPKKHIRMLDSDNDDDDNNDKNKINNRDDLKEKDNFKINNKDNANTTPHSSNLINKTEPKIQIMSGIQNMEDKKFDNEPKRSLKSKIKITEVFESQKNQGDNISIENVKTTNPSTSTISMNVTANTANNIKTNIDKDKKLKEGNNIIKIKYDVIITTEELNRLKPNNWLNSLNIRFYMRYLKEKHEKEYWDRKNKLENLINFKRIYYFPDDFLTTLSPKTFISNYSYKYNDLNTWNFDSVNYVTRQFNREGFLIFDLYDRLLFVVNKNNTHWLLVEINCEDYEKLKFIIYDPLMDKSSCTPQNLKEDPLMKVLTRYCKSEIEDKCCKNRNLNTNINNTNINNTECKINNDNPNNKINHEPKDCRYICMLNNAEYSAYNGLPQQHNFFDCGVFVCGFLRDITNQKDKIEFNQKECQTFREELIKLYYQE